MAHSPGADLSDHTLQARACGRRLFINGASRLQPQKRQIEHFPDHEELRPPLSTDCRLQGNSLHNHDHQNRGISDSQPTKRFRNGDWPLIKPESNIALPEDQPSHSKTSNLLTQQCSSSQPRPSKFFKPRTNDRANNKPQWQYTSGSDPYIQQSGGKEITSRNEPKEQYSVGNAHPAKTTLESSPTSDELAIRPPSGLFRFGRSLAAAFNPLSWKMWPRHQGGTDRERTHSVRPGKVEDHGELNRVEDINSSAWRTQHDVLTKHAPYGKHDSGIESTDHLVLEDQGKVDPVTVEFSSEEKSQGRIFRERQTLGPWGYNQSVPHDKDSKPANLAFREQNLSSPNMHMAYDYHMQSDHPEILMRLPNGLRRLPSRKELQKQQKLIKRVSDLERRLETSRRQLAETLGEPIPEQASESIRLRFNSGMLPSLPSVPFTVENSNSDSVDVSSGVKKVESTDQSVEKRVKRRQAEDLKVGEIAPHVSGTDESVPPRVEVSVMSNVMQSQKIWPTENPKLVGAVSDFQKQTPWSMEKSTQSSRKRKGDGFGDDVDGGAYRPSTVSEYDSSSQASEIPPPKRKPGRPRNLRKNDPEAQSLIKSVSVVQVKDKNKHPSRDRIPQTRGEQQPLSIKTSHSLTKPYNQLIGYHSSPNEEYRVGLGAILVGEVPPVPKLPTGVSSMNTSKFTTRYTAKPRGGDVLYTASDQDHKSNQCGRGENTEPFEWPDDVF